MLAAPKALLSLNRMPFLVGFPSLTQPPVYILVSRDTGTSQISCPGQLPTTDPKHHLSFSFIRRWSRGIDSTPASNKTPCCVFAR